MYTSFRSHSKIEKMLNTNTNFLRLTHTLTLSVQITLYDEVITCDSIFWRQSQKVWTCWLLLRSDPQRTSKWIEWTLHFSIHFSHWIWLHSIFTMLNNKFYSEGLSFAVIHPVRVYSYTTIYLCARYIILWCIPPLAQTSLHSLYDSFCYYRCCCCRRRLVFSAISLIYLSLCEKKNAK